MELKKVRTKSRPAIFNLKAPEAVTPRLPGDAQAALCLSSRAAPHAAQRPASNTLCLCPCRGLKYTKETQTVSAFPRRRNAPSLSLDEASKARTFLVTISSQRKRPGLGSEARAGCTRDKDACCPWRPATGGPVRPRLAASPNSPLPTTQNALSKDASLHTRAQRIQAEAKVDGNARPAPSLCGAHENRSPGSVSLSPEKNKGVDMCVQANERALSVGRFPSVLI